MSMISVPRNMKIQSMSPQMKIEFFIDEEIEEMKNYIQMQFRNNNKRSEIHKRYFALVITILRTGGRIDEILQLKARDFSLESNTIRLKTLKRKGEVYMVIPMHPELRSAILEYFLNSHIDPRSDENVFKMTRQGVDKYFKKMQSPLNFRIHAHKFRHTFAVKAIMSGVPLNVLQKWLGHASVFITNVYTEITGIDTRGFMEQVR
jgi:integrase/recombinase XerD